MKTIISILILIHGMIHLLGYLKAFELAPVEEMHLPVSKGAGLQWLVAAILFGVVSVLYYFGIQYWVPISIVSLIFSQILIIRFWQDAKTGTIPNLCLVLLLIWTY